MPLKHSGSQAATEENFDEVRHGSQFKRTAKKYGKKRARKQMVAIVLKNKREAQRKSSRRKRA